MTLYLMVIKSNINNKNIKISKNKKKFVDNNNKTILTNIGLEY